MDYRLLELSLGKTVLLRDSQVGSQLFGATSGDQRGDGDQTAVSRRKLGALPNVTEEDIVGK
jgi:hypothetical protein